jgi:soluble epoxide hydrolase / lipid-phosphate phosphatase
MEYICNDVLALLNAMHVDKVVLIGHDWGGTVVWNFTLHFPHRVQAVASFCTPFFPNNPKMNPWPKMKENPGRFGYQIFFQSNEARDLLELNPDRTVRLMIRASTDSSIAEEDAEFFEKLMGLLLVNGPNSGLKMKNDTKAKTTNVEVLHTKRSSMLSEGDEHIYGRQFRECGFLNPIRWYRNVERNWKWNIKTAGCRVHQPALMVTAGKDMILTPSMAQNMKPWFDQLRLEHIEEASHWITQQQPKECARILCDWIRKLPLNDSNSRL